MKQSLNWTIQMIAMIHDRRSGDDIIIKRAREVEAASAAANYISLWNDSQPAGMPRHPCQCWFTDASRWAIRQTMRRQVAAVQVDRITVCVGQAPVPHCDMRDYASPAVTVDVSSLHTGW